MPLIIAVTLVIIFTINGQDYERREKQDNLQSCWQHAQEVIKQIQDDNKKMDQLGVGCVIDLDHDPV